MVARPTRGRGRGSRAHSSSVTHGLKAGAGGGASLGTGGRGERPGELPGEERKRGQDQGDLPYIGLGYNTRGTEDTLGYIDAVYTVLYSYSKVLFSRLYTVQTIHLVHFVQDS